MIQKGTVLFCTVLKRKGPDCIPDLSIFREDSTKQNRPLLYHLLFIFLRGSLRNGS